MKKENTYIGVISIGEHLTNGCVVDVRKVEAKTYFEAETKFDAIGRDEYGGDFCVQLTLLLSDIIGERQ